MSRSVLHSGEIDLIRHIWLPAVMGLCLFASDARPLRAEDDTTVRVFGSLFALRLDFNTS